MGFIQSKRALASILTVFSLFLAQVACAHPLAGLKRGDDLTPVSPQEIAQSLPRGSVLVLGENHGLQVHRDQHMQILRALRQEGHRVSVGLEFFYYPSQPEVDLWRQGKIPEDEFLRRIAWAGTPFDFYRDQALFPALSEGSVTVALNAPRALTSRIARDGLEALTPQERSLLPVDFSLGNDAYRRRFLSLMPHLPNPQAGERYFAAQSAWDDTMAWRTAEVLGRKPDQTMVIVVGEFHVQYGGGLPDRLRQRLQRPIFTLSQVNLHGLSPEEARDAIAPSQVEGVRADWVWAEDAGQ